MIQDIEPRQYNNAFQNIPAQPQDRFLSFRGDTVLIKEGMEKLWYPSFSDFASAFPHLREGAQYLFSVDDTNYYLVDEEGLDALGGWIYVDTSRFRTEIIHWRSFVGAVGWQLQRWYSQHRFCSRCGQPMQRADKERMLFCESCKWEAYPTIAPCVIVGVHDGERLLLTKYAGRAYAKYALVAGYAEIGETLEQAAIREVKEEVGLNIKNLRYYKSQPWPFTGTLLVGFFAELDGDDTVTLQEDELALAEWVNRGDVPPDELKISLTNEMMEAFRTGIV